MENTATPISTTSVGLRYGLLTGIAWIIVDFIFRVTGLSFKFAFYLPAILLVYIIGIVLAHRYFKQHNDELMSYGQGVVIAVILALIAGLLSGIFSYIYVNFTDPSYMTRMRDDMEAWMSAMPNVQTSQIDQTLEGMSDTKGKSPMQIGQGLLTSAIIGLIMGVIVSLFTKHNRPEFE